MNSASTRRQFLAGMSVATAGMMTGCATAPDRNLIHEPTETQPTKVRPTTTLDLHPDSPKTTPLPATTVTRDSTRVIAEPEAIADDVPTMSTETSGPVVELALPTYKVNDLIGRLIIPRVGIKTDVFYGPDTWASPEDFRQGEELLEYGAVHTHGMPLPGEASNSTIANMKNVTHLFGHRSSGPAPFRDLDKVQQGDSIVFEYTKPAGLSVGYTSRYDSHPIVPIEVHDYTQAVNEIAIVTKVPEGLPPLSEAEWQLVESSTGLLRPTLPTIRLVACTSEGSTISNGSTHSRIIVDGEQVQIKY